MTLFNEIKEGLKISWDAIRANKMRSGLTTLGIIIGILSVTLMGTAISGLDAAFMKSISIFGTDNVFIQKFTWGFTDMPWWQYRNRRDITMHHARRMEESYTNAAAISVEAETMMPVKYKNKTSSGVWTRGNTDKSFLVNGFNLSIGRFLSEADVKGARPVCIIGAALEKNLFEKESPLGKRLMLGGQPYEVIGVMDKMGEFFSGFNLDNQIIVPLTRYMSDFTIDPNVSIVIKFKDTSKQTENIEEIRSIMRKIRRLAPKEKDDFSINQQETFIKSFRQVGGTIAAVGLFITGLSLFVGGIGIMNIMFVSVAERTKEIGIRKAIGARKRTIMIQFLIESASICLLGGLMGLALAYPVTKVISHFLPATMSLKVIAIAILVSIVTGVVSGFFPAFRAARMNPVDALRSE